MIRISKYGAGNQRYVCQRPFHISKISQILPSVDVYKEQFTNQSDKNGWEDGIAFHL